MVLLSLNLEDIFDLLIHLSELFTHLIKVLFDHLLDVVSRLINLLEVNLILVVFLKNLMILVLHKFDELLSSLGDLTVFFHLVVVFACCHDNDLELIIVCQPQLDNSVQSHVFKNISDLVTFIIQVSSLSERDDSLFVLDLLVRIDDNSYNKVDHQNVQQVCNQEPQHPK